jgi:hypothetical protein
MRRGLVHGYDYIHIYEPDLVDMNVCLSMVWSGRFDDTRAYKMVNVAVTIHQMALSLSVSTEYCITSWANQWINHQLNVQTMSS